MEDQWHDIEWIERYLDRSLNDEERKLFEKRLAEEPELKSMSLDHRLIIEGIQYTHLKDKLDQLKELEKSLHEITADDNQRWLAISWKPLAVAAGLILLAVSYLLFTQDANPQKLYTKAFEPYPNVFEPTVRGTQREDNRAQAFKAYDNADYQQAAKLFDELVKEKPEPGILLLLGNSNLMINKVEEAQNNFLTLLKDFEELDDQATWYLGLSYLKQGEFEKARITLTELSALTGTYSNKAKALLKEIK